VIGVVVVAMRHNAVADRVATTTTTGAGAVVAIEREVAGMIV